MNTKLTTLVLAALLWAATASPSLAVTITWSPVGNVGNSADTTVMNDGTSGYGSVPYAYNIGTYDVTNSQYVEFLNTKDPSGDTTTLGLYNTNMSNATSGGITTMRRSQWQQVQRSFPGRATIPVNFVTLVRRDPLRQLAEQRPGQQAIRRTGPTRC